MRSAIAFLVCALPAVARQATPPPPIEIRGVVLEVGTNLPVAEAEVTVDSVPKGVAAKTTTDAQGTFRITLDQLGTYHLRANKDGYTYDGRNSMRHPVSNQADITLDKEHPAADSKFVLARAGELIGRVVDEDTGKPIPNFRVYPIALSYYNGKPSQTGGLPAVTDSEGQFVFKERPPGNYLVETGPQTLAKEEFQDRFSADDLKVVDRDYRRAYWPGGGGLDSMLPVQLFSGGSADVGTIRTRKVPFYRIHVSIPTTDCAEGEEVFIDAGTDEFISGAGGGKGACGKDYLLRNFQPGSYQFRVMAGRTAEDRMRATLPVQVIDKNLDIAVPLGRGVDIEGRVVLADGSAKPPLNEIKIHMWSTGPIQFADERQPATPDAEGRFHFPNRPLNPVRVWLTGLSAAFVVREVRYNGSAVVDNIVALNGNAPLHSLQIVVDDKPAGISGTVADGDTPMGNAHVVLIRWPASLEDVFLSAKISDGDEAGRFQFAGLAPGDYRILAVSPVTAEKLDEPRVLERLLNLAERVTLTAGASQNLSLKATDPSR